jgi:hypothetical protein
MCIKERRYLAGRKMLIFNGLAVLALRRVVPFRRVLTGCSVQRKGESNRVVNLHIKNNVPCQIENEESGYLYPLQRAAMLYTVSPVGQELLHWTSLL